MRPLLYHKQHVVALKTWFLRQPLLLPALSLASAIFIADSSGICALLGWTACISFVFLSYFCSRKSFALTCLTAITGAAIHHQTLTEQSHVQGLAITLDGQPIEIFGIIDSKPRQLTNKSTEATVKVLHTPHQNTNAIVGKDILAYITNEHNLSVGEKLWLRGKLTVPSHRKNPQAFDKQSFLHRKNISAIFQVDAISPTGNIATSHKIIAFAEKSRQWIQKKLTFGIEDTDASKIILAMFLGEKPASDGHIITDFKNSGTIHVFAVSGLHVMMIGAIFSLLLKFCRAPLSLWIPSVILIMFFYAIVTGMRPPAMRASIMGATVLTAMLLLRKPSLPSCLWISAIVALLWDTHSLFLPGFQLSYIVLTAIAFTGKWWMERYRWINYIDPFMPESLLTRRQQLSFSLRKKLSASLAVSTSAWCGSSVLIWLYFGIVTPLAIIASIPLIIIVFALLGTCCLSLILGSISPTIGTQINHLNTINATLAHKISHSFASIPATRYQSQPWSDDERIIIYHLNDGGGAYLSLGGGILLDAGNTATFHSQILPGLKKNGAKLDTLIASHPDIKHIQGLTSALEKFPIKQLLIGPGNSKSTAHTELIHAAKEQNLKIITASEKLFPIAKGIDIEIIHIPDKTLPLADDRCIVFMLHWHDKRILFLNDSGNYFAHWLRQTTSHRKLTPDLLVIGKHARDLSLHPDIINLIAPKTIIATQALYPAEQARPDHWIQSIKNQNISLFLLNQSGAITITQDDNQLKLETTLDNSTSPR